MYSPFLICTRADGIKNETVLICTGCSPVQYKHCFCVLKRIENIDAKHKNAENSTEIEDQGIMDHNKSQKKLFIPIYSAFFVNGIMALLVGSILPFIIEEKGISFSIAGSLLSAFAIGNFLASFTSPVLCKWIGRKWTVILMTGMIPVCFFILSMLPTVGVMYILMILIGIGRGSCSVFSNAVVNDNSQGKPAAITLLHTTFSVGAFLAPFLTTLVMWMGFDWKAVVYLLIFLWILAVAGYLTIGNEKAQAETKDKSVKTDYTFLKNPDFYIMGFLLFFYLGVENCVNGWFVTYFRNSGIMSDSFANNLVSAVWVMVMAGRLVTARQTLKWERRKMILLNCSATVFFFIMLILTNNLSVITIAIIGLGFFLAGIYPTCISNMGEALKGSTAGISYLLAMAALGGIITPKIVGVAADRFGMSFAIMLLMINVAGMMVLAVINYRKNRKSCSQ